MTEPSPPSPSSSANALAWAGMKAAWLLTLGVLAWHVLYLVALNPYDIVADEAHYWEWSRYLSWSYYTKGPGVGWTIWASTALFGDAAWAIRLPAAISGAVIMLAVGRLAMDVSGDERSAFLGAAMVALCAPFMAVMQFMTIDAPFFACWALAAWLGWRAMTGHAKDNGQAWLYWLGLGAAVGVGFLYKYTILLLLPGLVLYAILDRRFLAQRGKATAWKITGAVLAFLICASPVFIWNQQHGWPTVAHLLGHLHMQGGDIQPSESEPWNPLSPLVMIGTQLGIVGPPLWALMALAIAAGWNRMRGDPAIHQTGKPIASGGLYLFLCGAPVVVFYLLVSFRTEVEPNWPVAGYLTLLSLAAVWLPDRLDDYAQRVQTWMQTSEPRPKRGWMRAKPETAWQVAWHWAVGWGVAAAVGIALAGYVAYLPLPLPDGLQRGLERATGHAAFAQAVQPYVEQLQNETGQPPLIIADRYQKASLLAYYLPGHPVVYCPQQRFGDRVTAYDFFAETDVTAPDLAGRNAVLVGGNPRRWREALDFASVSQWLRTDPPVMIGRGYQPSAEGGP